MVRVSTIPASKARRNKRHKLARGFTGRNKNLNRVTSGVLKRALSNQFVGRKLRKRTMRSLWITRIGIAARNLDTTYNALMNGLKKANIRLNRKMLADLAVCDQNAFAYLVKHSLPSESQ